MGKVHINSKTLESYVSIILQENTNIVGKELFDSDETINFFNAGCHYLPHIPFLNDV